MISNCIKRLSRQFIVGRFADYAHRLIAGVLAALLLLLLHSTAFAQSPYPQRVDRQINDYAYIQVVFRKDLGEQLAGIKFFDRFEIRRTLGLAGREAGDSAQFAGAQHSTGLLQRLGDSQRIIR